MNDTTDTILTEHQHKKITAMKLEIVSAEKLIFSDKVSMVFVMGVMGELGIAPGHTPLVTLLKPGHVRIRRPDNNEEDFYISGGMLEVQPTSVSILADTVIRAEELDEAAALEAKARAEKALHDRAEEVDLARATAELVEAIAQIHTLQKLRKLVK